MICYKGKCFCGYYKSCMSGDTCDRVLTREILKDSQKLGLYLSQFLMQPECFLQKKKRK
jgi:hypothetical protein